MNHQQRRLKILAAVLGLMGGALWTLSPGGVSILVLVGVVSTLFHRFVAARDRRFIVTLFLAGFVMRAVLSVSLDAYALASGRQPVVPKRPAYGSTLGTVEHTRDFLLLGDSDYYSERGYILAQRAQGMAGTVSRYYRGPYGHSGMVYLIGAFYYVFGYSPVAVKLINCLFGALMGPALFFLGRSCFNRTVARWSSMLAAAFPSLVLWSASNLKEPGFILLTIVLFLCFVGLQRAPRLRTRLLYALGFAAALGVHATLRSPVFSALLVGSLGVAYLVTRPMARGVRLMVIGAMVLGAVAARPYLRLGLWHALHRHVGYATTYGMSYRFLPDPFYHRSFMEEWKRSGTVDGPLLLGFGKALRHFLLEPFPKRMKDLPTVLVYPQMVWWYFILPLAVWGMVVVLVRDRQRSLFLILTVGAWTVLGTLTSGNVGAVFRLRDMVTPFVLMFACAGAWIVCCGPMRIRRFGSWSVVRAAGGT